MVVKSRNHTRSTVVDTLGLSILNLEVLSFFTHCASVLISAVFTLKCNCARLASALLSRIRAFNLVEESKSTVFLADCDSVNFLKELRFGAFLALVFRADFAVVN